MGHAFGSYTAPNALSARLCHSGCQAVAMTEDLSTPSHLAVASVQRLSLPVLCSTWVSGLPLLVTSPRPLLYLSVGRCPSNAAVVADVGSVHQQRRWRCGVGCRHCHSMFSGVRCSALTVDGQLFRSRKVSGGLLVSEEALGRPVTVLCGTQRGHLPSP